MNIVNLIMGLIVTTMIGLEVGEYHGFSRGLKEPRTRATIHYDYVQVPPIIVKSVTNITVYYIQP